MTKLAAPLPPLQMPSEERLLELLEKETKLEALMAAGVDNWEGYEEALRYDPEEWL